MKRWNVFITLGVSFLVFFGLEWYLTSHQRGIDLVADHGSQRTNEWGTKAIRELLGQSGTSAEAWGRSWKRLDDRVTQLWVINPQQTPDEEETRKLLEWVAGGGRVLVAVDPRGSFRGVLSGG